MDATYPSSSLGKRLAQIAQLVRSDVGLEVAVTECGGWDTHAGQGDAQGQLAKRLADLADSISAFATDLDKRLDDVCLVTVTEFGRTVRENGTKGTDHGHGSVMMVLGGKARGGKVYGKWKGLGDDQLWEGRDLAATTDHRDVFGEILRAHLGIKDFDRDFSGVRAGSFEPRGTLWLGFFSGGCKGAVEVIEPFGFGHNVLMRLAFVVSMIGSLLAGCGSDAGSGGGENAEPSGGGGSSAGSEPDQRRRRGSRHLTGRRECRGGGESEALVAKGPEGPRARAVREEERA